MIFINTLCDDLELRLSSAKPSQDFDIPKSQLIHWIDLARDQITRTLIDAGKADIDESIIANISSVPVSFDETTSKIKADLPYYPLDLNKGRGIISVVDSNGREYRRVSPEVKRIFSKMTFTKTSDCNLIYSLMEGTIYLNGISPEGIEGLTLSLTIVPAETNRAKNIDSLYYIMPSTSKDVIDLAEEIGRREISQGVYDISNDGTTNSDN